MDITVYSVINSFVAIVFSKISCDRSRPNAVYPIRKFKTNIVKHPFKLAWCIRKSDITPSPIPTPLPSSHPSPHPFSLT